MGRGALARGLLVATTALGISCAAHMTAEQRQAALEKSLSAIDPSAEPAPPQPPPADGRPAFNTEYYLVSQASEAQRIQDFGRQIQDLQRQAAEKRGQGLQRGFHAKSHGCLHGELRVDPARPPRTRFGLFAGDPAPMPVWVRFS